jgi:hypothetical protein
MGSAAKRAGPTVAPRSSPRHPKIACREANSQYCPLARQKRGAPRVVRERLRDAGAQQMTFRVRSEIAAGVHLAQPPRAPFLRPYPLMCGGMHSLAYHRTKGRAHLVAMKRQKDNPPPPSVSRLPGRLDPGARARHPLQRRPRWRDATSSSGDALHRECPTFSVPPLRFLFFFFRCANRLRI